jgi:hypothetical protein
LKRLRVDPPCVTAGARGDKASSASRGPQVDKV